MALKSVEQAVASEKRKFGGPHAKKLRLVAVTFRGSVEHMTRLAAWAEQHSVTQGSAIRQAIADFLAKQVGR